MANAQQIALSATNVAPKSYRIQQFPGTVVSRQSLVSQGFAAIEIADSKLHSCKGMISFDNQPDASEAP
jgi:hypothetical protein